VYTLTPACKLLVSVALPSAATLFITSLLPPLLPTLTAQQPLLLLVIELQQLAAAAPRCPHPPEQEVAVEEHATVAGVLAQEAQPLLGPCPPCPTAGANAGQVEQVELGLAGCC
jgi:hypothetical protein